MNVQHKTLADGRWSELNFAQQMANIGSEVERALNWKKKDRLDFSKRALFRCLELIDISLQNQNKLSKLRELSRVREVLLDYFLFENKYQSTPENLKKYFYSFNYLANLNK